MSKAKVGAPPALGVLAIAPILVAGALIGGTGLCVSLAARGMFRVGKKTFDMVDQVVADAVSKDLERNLAMISKNKISEDQKGSHNEQQDGSLEAVDDEYEKQELFFDKLNEFVNDRKAIEEKEKFDNKVSQEMQKEIDDYKTSLT